MMSLVTIKAAVFLMILCNAPSGGNCPIDLYIPATGFVTINATVTKSNLTGDSYTASYTMNGKSSTFSVVQPEAAKWEIRVNGQKITPDYVSTFQSLTQTNNLYDPQEITVAGKNYDFQETKQNYYLVDPNGSSMLIMPVK